MDINVDIQKMFRSITSCSCTNMTGAAQILFIIVNSLTKEHSIFLDQRAQIAKQQAQIAELIIDQKKTVKFPNKKEIRSSDFDYPKDISNFVRYMPISQPNLGSVELNTERLFTNWKSFLEDKKNIFSQSSTAP